MAIEAPTLETEHFDDSRFERTFADVQNAIESLTSSVNAAIDTLEATTADLESRVAALEAAP